MSAPSEFASDQQVVDRVNESSPGARPASKADEARTRQIIRSIPCDLPSDEQTALGTGVLIVFQTDSDGPGSFRRLSFVGAYLKPNTGETIFFVTALEWCDIFDSPLARRCQAC
jgi:hypothetical protein